MFPYCSVVNGGITLESVLAKVRCSAIAVLRLEPEERRQYKSIAAARLGFISGFHSLSTRAFIQFRVWKTIGFEQMLRLRGVGYANMMGLTVCLKWN